MRQIMRITDSYFSYKSHNKMLIYNLNSLNIFGTLYIFYKCDIFHCLPNMLMSITSALFWENPKNNYIRKYYYVFVILSIVSANLYSIERQRDHIVCSLTLCTMFLFVYSDYFKKKKHEKKSIICHSFTYLLGNIGVLIAYS